MGIISLAASYDKPRISISWRKDAGVENESSSKSKKSRSSLDSRDILYVLRRLMSRTLPTAMLSLVSGALGFGLHNLSLSTAAQAASEIPGPVFKRVKRCLPDARVIGRPLNGT